MKRTSDKKVMVVRSWHSRAHAGELSSAQRGQLMQESSALSAHAGELSSVSSCRRAQFCPKRSAHAGELSTTQRGHLMQESSTLLKEVSSALHKRSAHPGELSSDQRGQFSSTQEVSSSRRAQPMKESSATAHPFRPFRVKRP